jgi:hypothetical protein
MRIVNKQGLKEIHMYLHDLHRKGGDHFTDSMLHAWAMDVENSLNAGGPAEFEIHAWESTTGRAEVCRLSDEAYDIE